MSGGKWGNALSKSNGGRVEYATAGNYNVNKGTIEMWIKGPGIDDTHFNGLWGTDTSSGNGDIRMYIYNSQVNDGLRTLGAYQSVLGASFGRSKSRSRQICWTTPIGIMLRGRSTPTQVQPRLGGMDNCWEILPIKDS